MSNGTVDRPGGQGVAIRRRHLLVFHAGTSRIVPLPAEGVLEIGRAPEAAVRIDDPAISRRHATLKVTADQITITDLESQSGTLVNHKRIAGEHVLQFGDTITLHDATLVLHRVSWAPTPTLVLDRDGFRRRLEGEVERFLAYSRPFSLAAISWSEAVASPNAIEDAVRPLLGPVDCMSWTSTSVLHVLLVEAGDREATTFVTRARERLEPALRIAFANCPIDGTDLDDLLPLAEHGRPQDADNAHRSHASTNVGLRSTDHGKASPRAGARDPTANEPMTIVLACDEAQAPRTIIDLFRAGGADVQLRDPRITSGLASAADCVVMPPFDETIARGLMTAVVPVNREQVLAELSSLSVLKEDLTATLEELASRLARAFDADDCILVLSEDTTCYSARVHVDSVLEQLVPIAELASELRTTVITANRANPYRAFVGVPLAHEDAVPFARLLLCREEPAPFTREARRYLGLLAQRLSIDLSWRLVQDRLEAERNKLHDMSRFDPVLGIANRLSLQDRLTELVSGGDNAPEQLSVAVIDVDSLRLINERHGYRAGDAVLARVAKLAREHVSTTDAIARYASDSIALVLPGRSGEQAVSLVTRILTHIDDAPVSYEGDTVHLTVSAGVAEVRPNEGGDAALSRAAAARQLARVSGDVVTLAEPDLPTEPAALPDYSIGTSIGVYQIRHEISRGGFGVVYRAEDLSLGRQVALKVLRPDLATDHELVERFRAEAATLARIRNPNLVQVYAFGIEHSNVYFAMELVEGQGLDHRVALARKRQRHLPISDVCAAIEQIGGALDAMHRAGVLHRDVKPENILIDRTYRRYALVDLGIAVPRGDAKQPAGTPGYTAPEVFGEDEETPATDVYSLAAVAYVLLTLRSPFGDAGALVTLIKQQAAPPPRPSKFRNELSQQVDDIVQAALEPNPQKRPQNARQFAKMLSAALEGRPVRRSEPNFVPLQPDGRPRITIRNQTAAVRNASTIPRSTRGILFRAAADALSSAHPRSTLDPLSVSRQTHDSGAKAHGAVLGWYPTSAFTAMFDSLDVRDPRSHSLAEQTGRTAVAASFEQFFGANPRLGGPTTALAAVERLWRCYHSWGTASVTLTGDSAVITVIDGIANALLCSCAAGIFAAIVAGAGAESVDHAHPTCVAHGADRCTFFLSWKQAQ